VSHERHGFSCQISVTSSLPIALAGASQSGFHIRTIATERDSAERQRDASVAKQGDEQRKKKR
jgi:hypothetical protein